MFAALEIYNRSKYYTWVVDIWAWGVLVFKYIYELPKFIPGRQWGKYVVSCLNDQDDDDVLIKILKRMLVIDPEARSSAKDLLDEVMKIPIELASRSQLDTLFDTTQVTYGATEKTISLNYAALGSCESTAGYLQPTPLSTQNPSASSRKRDRSSVRASKTNKRRNSALEVFYQMHSNWLTDPNLVGSSVAKLGKSISDVSSTTTPKCSVSPVENITLNSLAQVMDPSSNPADNNSSSAFPITQLFEANHQTDNAVTNQVV